MKKQNVNSQMFKAINTIGLFIAVLLASAISFGQMTPPPVPPLTPENTASQTSPAMLPSPEEPALPAQPQSQTEPMPPLPSLPATPATNVVPVPDNNNTRPSATAAVNPNFQSNFKKPFVGKPSVPWPPTFGPVTIPTAPTNPVVPANSPVMSSNPTVPSVPVAVTPEPTIPQQNMDNNALPNIPTVNNTPNMPPMEQPAVPSVPQTQTVTADPATHTNPLPQMPENPSAQQPMNPVAQQPQQQVPQTPLAPQAQQTPQQSAPQAQQSQQIPQTQQPAPQAQPNASASILHGGSICALNIRACQPGEHPMAPLVPWAEAGLKEFGQKIQDYTCMMTKRERIHGKLTDTNSLFMKVREKPYSVYVYYLTPESKKGMEALYRKGYHNDQLLGHDVGFKAMFGAVWLDPKGRMAMMGQKYPITDAGIPNLVRKMLETVTMDLKNDPQGKNTTVKITENGGEIDGRPCVRIDVSHPKFDSCYRFHMAEIYLDKEWGVPVRYAAWMWPKEQGGKPLLDEEFTMTKIKFNVGLTDNDFSENNKDYNFQKKK